MHSENSSSFYRNPSRTKIDFDISSFEKHLSTVISDLELVNSSIFEDHLLCFDSKEFNVGTKFEPFDLARPEDISFEHNLSTSSYLEHLIVADPNEIDFNLDDILT